MSAREKERDVIIQSPTADRRQPSSRQPITRRDFLTLTAAAGLVPGWSVVPRWSSRRREASWVIRGGLVYDGTGRGPVTADIAILDDRIVGVGPNLQPAGAVTIDARGLAVAPGFIDIHSHTDLELLVAPRAESKIRQGVTTEVAGQDGSSIGPWTDEVFGETRDRYKRRYGVSIDFRTLPAFLERLEREPGAVNFASMVGAGTIRAWVVGSNDRPAEPAEMDRMVRAVQDALAAGACGLSTGLEYIPGAFADLDELVALARPLAAAGLPYATHMRNEDDQLIAAIEEAVNVARLAGVPLQISHLKAQGTRNWWKADAVLHMLERVRADGLDVRFDRYPYVAYSTGLSSLFPVWAREGGTNAFLDRLADPSLHLGIETAVANKISKLGSWDAVQITSTGADHLGWARGRRLGELATERGVQPFELLHSLILEDRNRTGMVGFGMSEENTARMLTHPLGMVCSDGSALATEGPLAEGTPHPRSYGTFPRVLGHYCRDRGTMPLQTAIHKMTAMPADRLRLSGRGRIAANAYADLVVFDPDRVADTATFEDPHRYAAGIHQVMVNGSLVLDNGEHTGARPGRIMRPSRSYDRGD